MLAERVSVEKSCLVIMGSCQNLIDIASLILSLVVVRYSSLSISSGGLSVIVCSSDPLIFIIRSSVFVVVCRVRSSKRLRALSCCGACFRFIVWISLHNALLLIECAMRARAVPLPLSLGDVYMSLISMERLVSDVERGLGFTYLY